MLFERPAADAIEGNPCAEIGDLATPHGRRIWAGSFPVDLVDTFARTYLSSALGVDGAFLTHSQHMVKIPSAEAARQYLPPYDLAVLPERLPGRSRVTTSRPPAGSSTRRKRPAWST